MTTVVITGGPDIDLETIASVCEGADRVICADSGAQNALLAGIRIDKVVGDLDSLSDEAKAVLKEKNITVDLYPVEKDMTDTEIAIREIPTDHEIRLISSLSGRQDHLMTNILLAVKLRGEGRDISVTDGITDMIPMSGVMTEKRIMPTMMERIATMVRSMAESRPEMRRLVSAL